MAESKLILSWTRPTSSEGPIVWHTFKARDIDSESLVEYRIQELPQSRFDDAMEHMFENFIQDEPIAQQFSDADKLEHFNDYEVAWNLIKKKHTALVCFKEGSDEIIGLSFTFVISRKDNFEKMFLDQCKSRITKTIFGIAFLMYANFNVYDHYGVDKYLTSFGLTVSKKYHGRAIGDHFMMARKAVCKEFNIALTHTIFSSDFSDKNAAKAGFKKDAEILYADVSKTHPEFDVSNVKSKCMTLRTLVF